MAYNGWLIPPRDLASLIVFALEAIDLGLVTK